MDTVCTGQVLSENVDKGMANLYTVKLDTVMALWVISLLGDLDMLNLEIQPQQAVEVLRLYRKLKHTGIQRQDQTEAAKKAPTFEAHEQEEKNFSTRGAIKPEFFGDQVK